MTYLDESPPPGARPEPITARSLGILNVVFGILFILAAAYGAGVVVGMPAFARFMAWAQQQEQQKAEAAREARKAQEARRLEAAGTDEEREAIEAERVLAELNEVRAPDWLGFSMGFLDDPRLRAGALAKFGATAALNGLLIASGIGLIRLRPWGRPAALAASALLILSAIGFAVATAGEAEGMAGRWTAELRRSLFDLGDGDEAPPEVEEALARYRDGMGRMFAVAMAGSSGVEVLYPAIVLVVAARPGVRRALVRGRGRGQGGDGAAAVEG